MIKANLLSKEKDVTEPGPAVNAAAVISHVDCEARAGQNPLVSLPRLLTRVERADAFHRARQKVLQEAGEDRRKT